MNIEYNVNDNLTALLTVTIEKEDYKDKVEEQLKKYRKTASIKGFRKGTVPMGYIRKQYEKTLVFDEVNQLLQKQINEYIQKENISILGNPLPKEDDSFDWDADRLKFDFELGLAPEFDVDLGKVEVEAYKIKVGDEEVKKYANNFAERYGSVKSSDSVNEKSNIKIHIRELDKDKNPVEGGLDEETFLFADELKSPKKYLNKKVGDKITLRLADINDEEGKLEERLGWDKQKAEDFDGWLETEIKEISAIEPSPMDQSLFDKVYGKDSVKSEKEFLEKIRTEAEKMYVGETDRQLMNDAIDTLLKEVKFDLPDDFLRRWLHFSNEEIKSEEEAAERLKQEEEGLRYQLIESKIAEKYDLKIESAEVEDMTRSTIKDQFAMYGHFDIPEEEMEKIVQNSIQNQDEFRKMADRVFTGKLTALFKEKLKLKEKEVAFKEFADVLKEKRAAHTHDHDHDHDHEH